jgi:hypothetical protein
MAVSNPTPVANKRGFSTNNAPYMVEQDATIAQVMDGMGCFLSASLAAFESMSSTFTSDSPGYAALYALRQANALHGIAERLVGSEWQPKASA